MTGAEWLLPIGMSALLACLGWLIVNKLNRIDAKLDRIEDRQGRTEKDCVTWEALDKELGPVRKKAENISDRLLVVETQCKKQHGA